MKCDETKPYCRKCIDTGRKCDGPLVRQLRFVNDESTSSPSTSKPQLEVSLLTPQHSDSERRAFQHFTHRVAPILAAAVDASFWEGLVPRLAQTYNFVWDAVVCISSLIEHVPYTSLKMPSDPTGLTTIINREHQRALKLYIRAIANVRKLAERAQIDKSVVAFSYILFASVEYQQRNVKTGNELVKKCCKILTDNITSSQFSYASTEGKAIDQVIAPFVLRKAVTIATFGNGQPPQWVSSAEVDPAVRNLLSRFTALEKSISAFQALVFRSYEVIRLADFVPVVRDDDPGKALFMSQRQSLLDELLQWKVSFTTASSQMSNSETQWMHSYLLMYWAVCYVSLATCISHRQRTFDHYMEQFEDIVQYATVYLEHNSEHTQVQILSNFEPGILPPLYFCAIKCRHPTLRREALRLIRQIPRHEALWAFVTPDIVIEKVISMEERGFHNLVSKQCLQRSDSDLLPEENRFAYVSVTSCETPIGCQRPALELGRYEFASDGSRKLLNTYVLLDSKDEM